jgi:hypothetical protein
MPELFSQVGGGLSPGQLAQLASAHPPMRLATQVPIASVAGAAPLTVDGATVAVDDRILRRFDGTDNGIWRVVTPGTGANGTWVRADDYDSDLEVESTVILFVQEGAADADSYYRLDTNPPITVGATALTYTKLVFGNTTSVLFDFSFATVSPALIQALGGSAVVEWAQVIMTTVFDDPAATLSLGTTADPSGVLSASQIDPTELAVYSTESPLRLAAPSTLQLTISPGASTQGAGYVLARIRP